MPYGSKFKALHDSLTHLSRPSYKKTRIGEKCYLVGSIHKSNVSVKEQVAIELVVGKVNSLYKFQRLIFDDHLIHCREYKRVTKRNNYTVQYRSGHNKEISYGHVNYYVRCHLACPIPSLCSANCVCKEPCYNAMISKLHTSSQMLRDYNKSLGISMEHLFPVSKQESSSEAVMVQHLLQLCVYVDVGHAPSFIGLFPNCYEKD